MVVLFPHVSIGFVQRIFSRGPVSFARYVGFSTHPSGAGTRQTVIRNRSEGELIMRRSSLLAALMSVALAIPSLAYAGVVAQISLTTQRMQVYVNGKPTYTWKVSTARSGYRTPTGTYKPTTLSRYHRSSIYDGSPMPYSIFFYKGYAIHGSYETKYLGRPASHGCVRLHPSNAAALYSLVQRYGPSNTTIKITR
jgi:L,D-transpeptidase catalytic domain